MVAYGVFTISGLIDGTHANTYVSPTNSRVVLVRIVTGETSQRRHLDTVILAITVRNITVQVFRFQTIQVRLILELHTPHSH